MERIANISHLSELTLDNFMLNNIQELSRVKFAQ